VDGRRWLLVGASGLVGSHLRTALQGRDVTLTSYRTPIVGSIPLDLTDRAAIARVSRDVRPDVILLAAADAFVELCEREPEATRKVNVDPIRSLTAAVGDGTLVVFSSEYVFDGLAGDYAEDDDVAPINEYGRQKVEIEALARAVPRHLILRLSGVYGWSAARTSFVAQLVDRLRSGRRFTVPSDQLITPTPAQDLAPAIVDLIEHGASGTFHAAGPEIVARADFAIRAAKAFGLDASLLDALPTAQLGLAAPRPTRAGLRTEKLRAFLGRSLASADSALAAMREREPR